MIPVVRLEAPLRPPASQLHRDRDRPSSHRGGADGCGMVQTVAVFVCCRPPEENQPGKLVSQAGRVNSWRNFGYLYRISVQTPGLDWAPQGGSDPAAASPGSA